VKSDLWLSRLLGLWLLSFWGLLVFLYMLFIGCEVGGRSMFQFLLR
jgi:hypothetical protein